MSQNEELLSDQILSEESIRLGSDSPLKTILKLSIGPLIFQFGNTLYGIVDSFWISKVLGKKGLSIIGASFVPQYLIHGFNLLILISITGKISYFHGKKSAGKIINVIFDLFRLCIILGFFVPIFILSTNSIILKFLGSKEETIKNSKLFLMPLCLGFFITSIHSLLLGIFQANGLTIQYGLFHLFTNLLKILIFDPLLLFIFKLGILSPSISIILSQLFIIPLIYYYIKKNNIINLNFN